jgi:polyphenol oxidase
VFWWREQVDDGLWAGFTSTAAGNLALHVPDDAARVQANRRGLEREMGIQPGSLAFMNQVHSATVRFAAEEPGAEAAGPAAGPDSGPAAEADAMVSASGRRPLAVLVADCVPVVLAAEAGGRYVTAVAHAGRRGLLDGVIANTVAAVRARGGGAVRAWIGPAVCGNCYEVPEQMQHAAAAALPLLHSTTSWGTPALDLPAGVEHQLASLDVTVERIPGCTMENEALFSYRRDSRAGRFAGLVWQS